MHPVFFILKKPILAKAAISGSRSLPYLRLASDSPYLSHGVRNMFRWALKFVGGSVVVFSGFVFASAVNRAPFTDRWRLCMTSPEEDVEVGYRLSRDMLSQFPRDLILPASHPMVRLVQQVANKLVDGLGDDVQCPTIRVIAVSDSNTSAYSLPNGDIIIHAGLLGTLSSVDELAVVLSHEIAHVICRHSAEIVTLSDLLAIPSGFLYSHAAGSAPIRWFALKMARPERILAELPVSRKVEIEADIVGLTLMRNAGFDPRVAQQYWDRVSRETITISNCFTSTHPSGEDRKQAIEEHMATLGPSEVSPADSTLKESIEYWINRVKTETQVALQKQL